MDTIQIREVNVNYGKKRKLPEIINSGGSAYRFLKSILPNNSQEHLIALYLNGAHQPIAYSIVCTGLATSCPIHPREVYQRAILVGAYSVILAHNHPSDQVEPSREDREVTRQMSEAAKVLGLRLLDHVIISETNGYYSFSEKGDI